MTVVEEHNKDRVTAEVDDKVKIGLSGNGLPDRKCTSRHNASESTISIAFNAAVAPSPTGPWHTNRGSSMAPVAGIMPAKQFRQPDSNVHLKQWRMDNNKVCFCAAFDNRLCGSSVLNFDRRSVIRLAMRGYASFSNLSAKNPSELMQSSDVMTRSFDINTSSPA